MSAAPKKTPWFPATIKPVRIGRYEVQGPEHWKRLTGANVRFWDGEVWRSWEGGPKSIFGDHHLHQWRGLVAVTEGER